MAGQITAEGKPQKPGLLRRIIWGLWVILLTALLVFGLVFAAPWKVITLIAIFLAAATILPRIYRKWFWFGIAVIVLWITIWVFLPDDNKGWKPYQFDKELAQLQAKYAVPNSGNAAIVYNQILADWKQKEANEPNLPYDKLDFARHTFWLTKDQPEIAAYIRYHRGIIEQLIQASKMKQCSFPIIADAFILGEQMERITTIRRWAYLLVASGNNDIAEGMTNEALEKYFAVLRMGQHLSRQPSVIEMLVSFATEALGLGGINNFVVLGDANELHLSKAEQAISEIKHDWSSDLPGFIDSEKLMVKNLWGITCYQVNVQRKIRFSHDPTGMIKEQTGKVLGDEMADGNDIFSGYWWKKLMKAYTIPYWFYMPETPEKLGEIIDTSFENHYKMAKPDFDWSKKPESPPAFHFKINVHQLIELMAKINKGVYPGLHDIYLRSSANQRGTLLIIAMRRYKNANGHWPEKLEDIKNSVPPETFIDPMNNSSFVYKQTDDGFTLYGKGKNGIDEDGKYENNWPAKPTADDLLIWPHKSKVSQQQEQKTEK